MKRIHLVKFMFMLVLVFSVMIVGKAQAASHSLGEGTYTVGVDLPQGLTKFSILNDEMAELYVLRNGEYIFFDVLGNNDEYSSQFTASLKNGDELEVYLYDGTSEITIQQIAKVDLNNLSSGFYEVGTDIPGGTYTLKIDRPWNEYDMAYLTILGSNYMEKDYLELYQGDPSIQYTLSKGDKLHISMLAGSMSLKEVILVPQSISLNKSSLSLKVNQTEKLTATVNPSTATNKNVTWTSSNPSVATVDSKGNVKALKVGSTTITATASGSQSIKKNIPVTVTKVVPSSIKLSKSALNISINQTYKVTATVAPTDAQDKTVQWKSSNSKVATVDSKGNIKGIASGSAIITATTKDNSKVYKKITVKVSTKTVKVNKSSLSITAGKTATLSATVSPSDSTDKTVKWTSSNTKIATVDSKGKVTAKTKGTVTMTASVKGAKDVKVNVTVTAPIAAKSVKLNKTSVTINKGKTYTLTASVSPSNTTNKTIKWKSSNTKVAKVDSKGKVTAIGAGTAKITATTSNGKASSATITVPYVKSLSAGVWKAGKDLPAGRYRITTTSEMGNLFIGSGTDRSINEILTREDDGFGVTTVTTDIKAGDTIEIMGLNSVQFTKVTNVKSSTLHAGYWTVGKDISAGKYRITTPRGYGNLFIYRGSYQLLVNEILSNYSDGYSVTSVTATLKTGDRIHISGLNKVVFTKK